MESQSSSPISPEIAGVTYPNMLRYVKFVLGLTAQHMKKYQQPIFELWRFLFHGGIFHSQMRAPWCWNMKTES